MMHVKNNLPFIPVVYYHSIGPVNKSWNRHFLTLELKFFEDQCKYFSKHFQTVFLREFLEMRRGKTPLVENALVITFDDGFLDNWVWAFPILKKYGLKATFFVCPEYVDELHNQPRPTLDDLWNHSVSNEELNQPGYLNWAEMKIMINSGFVDIQSHTMSHTKYMISDKLRTFHHPGNDCLYPVGNLYPQLKPYHIIDESFETKIPYGYPLFEEVSSVCARKVTINDSFLQECVHDLHRYDFRNYSFQTAMNEIQELYDEYLGNGTLITSVEGDESIKTRLQYEIGDSKRILEENLGTPVEFLCWPHGDNNDLAHQVAMEAGYLATTAGNRIDCDDSEDRIPHRIGMWHVGNSRLLSIMKTKYQIESRKGVFPYRQIKETVNLVRSVKSGG